jgi:hypothetical protein
MFARRILETVDSKRTTERMSESVCRPSGEMLSRRRELSFSCSGFHEQQCRLESLAVNLALHPRAGSDKNLRTLCGMEEDLRRTATHPPLHPHRHLDKHLPHQHAAGLTANLPETRKASFLQPHPVTARQPTRNPKLRGRRRYKGHALDCHKRTASVCYRPRDRRSCRHD